MKKKRFFIIAIILFIVFALPYASARVRIDGLMAELSALLLSSDTNYSQDYTHEGFDQITEGMSEQEVLELIGEPLKLWNPYKYGFQPEKADYYAFVYSESPTFTHYRLRQVILEDGIVKEIRGYFYVD